MLPDVSLSSWLCFFALVTVSTLAGNGLANFVPWTDAAVRQGFPRAFGLAIAPFLTGVLTILCLLFLPGVEHRIHLAIVMGVMIFGAVFYVSGQFRAGKITIDRQLVSYLLLLLLLGWCVLLVISPLFSPLTQNDALEYAIVGRELFYSRTLSVYPLIEPESSLSGFFGPWTHPPLYVSLIYIMNVIQGHADSPGLMRLISPWFLLTSTYAMVLLGRMRSQNVGLLAGILYISTPLLFFGAVTSLIDALPVSAMVLLILLLAGGCQKFPSYPVLLGCVLGISLLTHSVSILFIPLVLAVLLIKLDWNWRLFIRLSSIVFGVSFLIAGTAYIRNILIFGSPISDNPIVFTLPELDWQGYFSYDRGLNHWVAIMQYGVLKGWFCLEAYGAVFWLGMLGYLCFLRENKWTYFRGNSILDLNEKTRDFSIFTIGLVIVLLFLCGVVLSTVLGIDLMIRNERYTLFIIPPLALSAAFFVEKFATMLCRRLSSIRIADVRINFAFCVLGSVYAVAIFQLIIFGYYQMWRKLDDYAFIHVINEISRRVPEDALVLTMRPADMYYTKSKMISYLDPRLVPFYNEHSPEEAVQLLKNLEAKYVYVPYYTLPAFVHSPLIRILADPNLSQLIYSDEMYQLYELKSIELKECMGIDLTPGKYPWKRRLASYFGGRKLFGKLGIGMGTAFSGGLSSSSFPFFHRHYSVSLVTDSHEGGDHNEGIPVVSDMEYALKIKLHGNGFVRLWISEFYIDDRSVIKDYIRMLKKMIHWHVEHPFDVKQNVFGEISLSESKPSITYLRRFRTMPQTKFIRLTVEHKGRSQVELEEVILTCLVSENDHLFDLNQLKNQDNFDMISGKFSVP